MCMVTCGNGGKILGFSKLKLKCKCPRQSNGQKVCGWIGRQASWPAETISSFTCEGGSISTDDTNTSAAPATVTTPTPITTPATTLITTTAAPSGSGWVPGNSEFEVLTSSVSSGMTNCSPSGETRVVGGQTPTEGTWPWIANVFTRHVGDSIGGNCGGTIVGDKWVLTAAHCCWDNENVLLKTEAIVKFNDHDKDSDSPNEFTMTTGTLIPHPSKGYTFHHRYFS